MKVFALIAALSIASAAAAQPIHGHPQKTAYASPAEWPIRSFQGHWPGLDPVTTCHVHVEPQYPEDAELGSAPFVVPFTVVMHKCEKPARMGLFYGENIRSVVWDLTKSSVMPDMRNDPAVDTSWTGKATIDPTMGDRFAAPLHGWMSVRFGTRTAFDNGDQMDVSGWQSHFSVIDPTAPERPAPQGGRIRSARVDIVSHVTGTVMGTMVTEYQGPLPLAPIRAPFVVPVSVYNYTASVPLPHGQFEYRHDIDLHHGVRGTLLDAGTADVGGFNRTVTFDPAVMGPGAHREAAFWTQTLGAETVSSIIVATVTVAGVAPPLLCTDPLAPNFGGPAPCLPPIVVTPVWAPVTAFFERFGSEERYRLCDALHLSCRELVFK